MLRTLKELALQDSCAVRTQENELLVIPALAGIEWRNQNSRLRKNGRTRKSSVDDGPEKPICVRRIRSVPSFQHVAALFLCTLPRYLNRSAVAGLQSF